MNGERIMGMGRGGSLPEYSQHLLEVSSLDLYIHIEAQIDNTLDKYFTATRGNNWFTMDLQRTTKQAPHCAVLLIRLSQWAVEYASSDLPFPLLMLIVIDISHTLVPAPLQWTRKPLNITNNKIHSYDAIIHPETLPYGNYGHPHGAAVTRRLWKDFAVTSKVWPSGILCMWKATAFIFCPFVIPVCRSPLLHSSIRPLISPSISSYSLCSMRICLSCPCEACAFIYRRLGSIVHFF